MNENASETISAPAPAPEPTTPPPRKPLLTASRLIAALALLVALGVWLYTARQIHGLEAELARRLSAIETRSNESRVLAGQAQEAMRELLVKIGVLEQKLQESQDQQLALEALYQELARGRDEATLAEIEQLVYFASQQLQLSGNVKAALIALQNAESRLSRSDKPQFHRLRQVLARDIERLRASPAVDVTGLSLRLSELIDQVDELPLFPASPGSPAGTPAAAPASAQGGLAWWKRFAAEVWSDFTQLVRIQDTGRPELPLLPPEQAYYARENLKLRLLTARLALLHHDETGYRRDLKAAQEWLVRYFDSGDKRVKAAASLLRQLAESPVRVDLPDISASVAAVRDFRLAPERGTR